MKVQRETRVLPKLLRKLRYSTLAFLLFPNDVEKKLHVLGEDVEQFYLKKLKLSGGLLIVGILMLILYVLWYQFDSVLFVEEILRPEPYEQTTEISLEVNAEQESYKVQIFPQELSKEQADKLFEELSNKLGVIIQADNQSLEQVTSQLYLPEYIDSYPFDIYWESDKETIVTNMGTVNRYGLIEDEIVVLTGTFYYKEWIWEIQFAVCVAKEEVTIEELHRREIQEMLLEAEEVERTEEVFKLPQKMEDRELIYGIRKNKDSILFLAALLMITAVILWLGQDNDLRREFNQNKAVFEENYIILISKISMYISAGVTLPVAMNLYINDYFNTKPATDIFYRALSEFNRDIQNGQSFSLAINRFADKASVPSYKRMAGIFGQSILNGSRDLSGLLGEEVRKTQEEKKRKSKVKGEQISAALIAPMMLQLGVVIALVMIPAFMNMQF